MTPPRTNVRFLVVGGGIGGLAAALALARVGREVHVLEAAPEFGEIGAGIQLGPNATQMLERLDVLEELRPHCFFPQSLAFMDALSGEPITSVDLGDPFVAHYGTPYVVVHRTDLHSALLEACRRHERVALETDRKVTRVEDRDTRALAHCDNGASYECDALIGADGLRSVVRRLMSEDEPVQSGYVAYRGTIAVGQAHLHEYRDSMVYWWGPNMHLVQYKVRAGELYNQVGVFRSERFEAGEEDWGTPEELDERFGRGCEHVRSGASLLERGARWPMIDRDPIDNWTRNRITLLGDAAHPMLQYLAQGGCQAIEDAVCLGDMVAAHDDLETAFGAYQAKRIPHTARVQTTARKFGEMIHIEGIGIALRNRLLGMHAPDDYEPLDWLYRADARSGGPQLGADLDDERLGAGPDRRPGPIPRPEPDVTSA